MSNNSQAEDPQPLFKRHVDHLRLPLQPLLSIQTGVAHPSFPPTLLHYHLLTEAELDELTHFYHQRTPSSSSFSYPAPIVERWKRDANIDDKRRRFGRFVGLRGCESPLEAQRMQHEMDRWVAARIKRGLEQEAEKEMWRSKGYR